MGVGEDVRRRNLIGPFTQGAEEMEQHPGISLDGAPGARASFFFSEEGIQRALPLGGIAEGGDCAGHDCS